MLCFHKDGTVPHVKTTSPTRSAPKEHHLEKGDGESIKANRGSIQPTTAGRESGARKRRRHSSCLTPCVGLIGCNQRFSEGDCASRSEHPRPLALPGECSRDKAGASRAFASASCQRSSAASSLHRPPVSIATTTSRHRLEVNSSGYVASFSQRAWTSTAASSPILRRSAYLAWIRGWSRMLAVSCGSFRPLDGVASSLRFAGH